MKKVFLDANVLIEVGLPPFGPVFTRLLDLVKSHRIKILTPDITMAEVVNHHIERDLNEIKGICNPRLHEVVEEATNTEFPTLTEKQLHNVIRKKCIDLFWNMLNDMEARYLQVSEVKADRVFSEYFNKRGLFAEGRKKTNSQMPLYSNV